ncbi:cell division protein FtsA [Brevibacillus fulvus]|uniref:Cell division protein FtsA n=1 Tax=Brevibacillus fulvus TaxID=1125967 RepID=A0A938Y1Q1_9BACL|nr:cell division FtsA domain-containing protein [Brevibacillus fulvus]MBM7590789.1 cell division protein FtsA [Brevibacillus fulvus]
MSHDLHTSSEGTIFALDIGTRSVVGLIVEPLGDKFRVIDCAIQEHSERSMLDGQIHDIVAVAEVIQQVKERLAEKHGPLTKVAVAAAGRSLRTRRATAEMEIRQHVAFSRDDVLTLEFTAVQEAQAQLAQELNDLDSTRYYCVGYSVVRYLLDDEPIGSLIDQHGDTASVEVIATFLPRIVVDSLLAALKRCDLEMSALTLEPIAAINVLIPPTMRRLNIALIDIGAGTSDVALTEEGTITAYGMVPVAGDEITDALMNAFLLDFPMAEQVKRSLNGNETVTFQDILGIDHTLPSAEIVAAIDGEINKLAQKIAEKILELNGRAPQAVMLIGGGSLTPKLTEKVAGMLELPAARVAVRGADAIQQFVESHPLINGPEFVTPVGIAVAARRHPLKYITVTVNELQLRIFDLRKMNVGDALIAAGLDIRRLHGRPGLAMTVTMNGRMRIIPGEHGTAASITKNGEPVGLDAPIDNEDKIVVIRGTDGKDAQALVADVCGNSPLIELSINGQAVCLEPLVFINGVEQSTETPLADRDQVEIRMPQTIAEALRQTGFHPLEAETLKFRLNGQEFEWPRHEIHLLQNGRPASLQQPIQPGDEIVYEQHPLPLPAIKQVIPPEEWIQEEVHVMFNEQRVAVKTGQLDITMNGNPVTADATLTDGAIITVKALPGKPPVFSDVFRFVEVSLVQPEGSGVMRLITRVNGEDATFQTEIKSGDKLELYWEKSKTSGQ